MNKKELQLSTEIKLAEKESKVRAALLCRTGSFDGLFGPVTITKERLEALAAKYIVVRSKPQNENDYAPILLNHDRNVDNVKGRLLADGIEVREWKEIDGVMQYGLYGNLRIDDPEAHANVESGKYAHLSISFDEETNEIFEVSFVAVEAARGAIVLAQGEKHMQKRLEALTAKHKALAATVKQGRVERKKAITALAKKRADLEKEALGLIEKSKNISLTVKLAQTKAKFVEFVKQGKMNPVELKSIDFKEVAEMGEKQLTILLKSFEARPVSEDVFQFGQSGANKPKLDLSPEKMREAIKLQKSGKKVSLADAPAGEEDEEKKKLAADADKSAEELKSYAMGKEEWEKCLEEMTSVHAKLAEVVDKIKGMGAEQDKLLASEDEQEKKEEKELAAEEEPKDKEGEE